MKEESALVLLSGGQDSSTCLLWALNNFKSVKCVNIFYGQRHYAEVNAASKICQTLGLEYNQIVLDFLSSIGNSALFLDNKDMDISASHESNDSLPASFVPGRNIFFLTTAAAIAYKSKIHNIVTGVCQTDYSGYPDCRQETIHALENTLELAMDYDFTIHTPLMHLTKKETVELAVQESPDRWKEIISLSMTCYEGQVPPCGMCPACKLRIKGFEEAGLEDPIFARLRGEI